MHNRKVFFILKYGCSFLLTFVHVLLSKLLQIVLFITQEREMKRQQAEAMKSQEKERRKQHMMMVRALESQRKAEVGLSDSSKGPLI